jgi:hypothetical protein
VIRGIITIGNQGHLNATPSSRRGFFAWNSKTSMNKHQMSANCKLSPQNGMKTFDTLCNLHQHHVTIQKARALVGAV